MNSFFYSCQNKGILLLVFLLVFSLSGCTSTLERLVINSMADSLGDDQSLALTGEDDPELLGDALPFMLKMSEMILEGNPRNKKMILSLVRGHTSYANQWLEFEATVIEEDEYKRSVHLRNRATLLYLRARNYGFQGFNLDFPQFSKKVYNKEERNKILPRMRKLHVPFLTWTGLAWMAYLGGAANQDPTLALEIPIAVSLLERAIELDETFEAGQLHEFFLTYYGLQLGVRDMDTMLKKARYHFNKTLEINKGNSCSVYVTWARNVSVTLENREEFIAMLEKGLAIDVNKVLSLRLANRLCQRKARWLQEHIDDFFL